MKIFYVQYEAVPFPESEDYAECGGAYVNCWLRAESEEQASQAALALIREEGWEIVSVEEESREVVENYYSENESDRKYYEQALTDGECFVFHKWPVDVQEGDDVH